MNTCPFCKQPVEPGQPSYKELDAPASPLDEQRMKAGQSYVVDMRIAHGACNPRARLTIGEFSDQQCHTAA